jgi:hypothetical protein
LRLFTKLIRNWQRRKTKEEYEEGKMNMRKRKKNILSQIVAKKEVYNCRNKSGENKEQIMMIFGGKNI